MPHLIIEYTNNLDGYVDKQAFIDETHKIALATGIFKPGGIKVRLLVVDDYKIADGHPDNGFIHIHMRVGYGRDEATRHKAAEQIFQHLAEWLDPVFASRPFGFSVELNEIPPETNFKKNNLHEYLTKRAERIANGD